MVNSGSITLQGVTDKDLVKLLEIKIRHEKVFFFNPQPLQPQNVGNNQPTFYNNVIFSWHGEQGLAAVHEFMSWLLKKEEKAASA